MVGVTPMYSLDDSQLWVETIRKASIRILPYWMIWLMVNVHMYKVYRFAKIYVLLLLLLLSNFQVTTKLDTKLVNETPFFMGQRRHTYSTTLQFLSCISSTLKIWLNNSFNEIFFKIMVARWSYMFIVK